MRDKIIQQVVAKFQERSDVGYKKYGVTLHDDEPNLHKWLNHLQEELMDAVNYIQKLKMETTNALQDKLANDYLEEEIKIDTANYFYDKLSDYPGCGCNKRSIYPGDVYTQNCTCRQ